MDDKRQATGPGNEKKRKRDDGEEMAEDGQRSKQTRQDMAADGGAKTVQDAAASGRVQDQAQPIGNNGNDTSAFDGGSVTVSTTSSVAEVQHPSSRTMLGGGGGLAVALSTGHVNNDVQNVSTSQATSSVNAHGSVVHPAAREVPDSQEDSDIDDATEAVASGTNIDESAGDRARFHPFTQYSDAINGFSLVASTGSFNPNWRNAASAVAAANASGDSSQGNSNAKHGAADLGDHNVQVESGGSDLPVNTHFTEEADVNGDTSLSRTEEIANNGSLRAQRQSADTGVNTPTTPQHVQVPDSQGISSDSSLGSLPSEVSSSGRIQETPQDPFTGLFVRDEQTPSRGLQAGPSSSSPIHFESSPLGSEGTPSRSQASPSEVAPQPELPELTGTHGTSSEPQNDHMLAASDPPDSGFVGSSNPGHSPPPTRRRLWPGGRASTSSPPRDGDIKAGATDVGSSNNDQDDSVV